MRKTREGEEINNWVVAHLDDKSLDGLTLCLKGLRQGRFWEERYFELYLKDRSGRISEKPVVSGLYFAGRGKWIKPWLEISYSPHLQFKNQGGEVETFSLEEKNADVSLFNILASLVPPGGHLAVGYGEDETGRALDLGIPAAATPLGYLLWKSGFRWFKNWYFPEGWREGGTKLQGNKPLDEKIRKKREEETAEELRKFVEEPPEMELGAIGTRAGRRAQELLSQMEAGQGD